MEENLPDCEQVAVVWLPFEGGEGVISLFEEVGDCISIHVGWLLLSLTHKLGSMFLGKRRRTVAIEDCNDDDQSNGVGKGKLRVLCACGNLPKCVGSQDGNGGSGSLIGIKFELDFHCPEEQGGPKAAANIILV